MAFSCRQLTLMQILLLTIRPEAFAADGCAKLHGSCEDDTALLLQNPKNHESERQERQERNESGKRGQALLRNNDFNESDVEVTHGQSALAKQMAKQMAQEFQHSEGRLLKLPGASGEALMKVNQNNPLKVSGEEASFFVLAEYQAIEVPAQGKASVEVRLKMAATDRMLWVHLLLWMPLLLGWLWSGFGFGQSQDCNHSHSAGLRFLVQLSVGALTISHIVCNQSLCILTRAPMALTLLQSVISVFISAMVWACQVWYRPMPCPSFWQICAGKAVLVCNMSESTAKCQAATKATYGGNKRPLQMVVL
eukprot:Skav232555  [mRNA]  locus=scaffold3309:47294:48217:- [translate_table: standard]